ncbi:MAG: ATP-binding cassette domain-containing protein [Deltaproteobacteria bacterium]|nr:ATP-binding cassette domain-containing protein [Deltaproteobacteria bacterium]
MLLIFLADLLVANFALITPLFSKILFDYAYPLRELFLLNVVVLASLGLYFLEFFINVMSDYLGTYIEQGLTYDLTEKLFDKCQRLPLGFHSQKTAGDLVNRFTSDLDTVVQKSVMAIPELVISLYTLVSILLIAFSMNYKITLLALCSVPLYILETKFFSKKEEKLQEESINLNSEFYDTLQEKFRSIKTIKAFGQESNETKRVIQKRRLMNIVAIKQGLVTIIAVFANSVTIRMWTIFISWYMGYLVIHGELTVGEIVAMLAYVSMLSGPIRELASMYSSLVVSMVSYKRLDEILTTIPEDIEGKKDGDSQGKESQIKEGLISFEKVRFSYGLDEKAILNDLTFSINAKTAVAIVGESGSGKSTIISLLMRFFDIHDGAISIDNQKITSFALRALRNQMGLVQQDFTLFAGTIRENILYGSVGKTENDIIRACRQAQCYDFILDFEKSFDTEIGVDGAGLSGGQKQRVAIARVMLRDPKIIIFDEATSALDPESEYKITEIINDLIGKKNFFIIAHRLSTIKKVDQIMMLEDGQIVEQGSFSALIDKKGSFFRYYSMQFGGFESFRKILEIEYERVHRYGSRFNLTAVEVSSYQEIHDQHGEAFAADYMGELELMFKKVLRKGDNSAVFYKNIIMIMLPEISEEGVAGFYNRVDQALVSQSITVKGVDLPVHLRYSTIHVGVTPFKVIDDLIKMTIRGLEKLGDIAGKNFVTQCLSEKIKQDD